MIAGYRDFEFDLPEALLSRLVAIFDGLPAARLEPVAVQQIPNEQGVYQLFLDDRLVYIGKTDAEAGLGVRLARHAQKIQHRIGLDADRVAFKAVRVYVFTAVDLERQLINHYGGGKSVAWNGSGFGANDPGRNRDETTLKDNHFDVAYPIDIDWPLPIAVPDESTAFAVLAALRAALPYTFRFEMAGPRGRQPHPDLVATHIPLTGLDAISARSLITRVVGHLPPGWQATKLPGYIILYKESKTYPRGDVIARS